MSNLMFPYILNFNLINTCVLGIDSSQHKWRIVDNWSSEILSNVNSVGVNDAIPLFPNNCGISWNNEKNSTYMTDMLFM